MGGGILWGFEQCDYLAEVRCENGSEVYAGVPRNERSRISSYCSREAAKSRSSLALRSLHVKRTGDRQDGHRKGAESKGASFVSNF
jgi:hypothetical protein